MVLTTYITYAEVRSVLGVSDDELEDTTLALSLYADSLELEFAEIDDDLATTFGTVSTLDEGDRTSAQQKFYRLTRLFAAYAVAKQLGSSLPMFGPKDLTDGKASFARFADSPYKKTLEKVAENYDDFHGKLASAYAALSSSSVAETTRTLFAGVGLATDPVVGS